MVFINAQNRLVNLFVQTRRSVPELGERSVVFGSNSHHSVILFQLSPLVGMQGIYLCVGRARLVLKHGVSPSSVHGGISNLVVRHRFVTRHRHGLIN